MKQILPVKIFAQQFTTTATPAEVDLYGYYATPGKRGMLATLSVISAANAASDAGSITVKLQGSATTVDSDFTDLTDGAFATVVDTDAPTTAGVLQTIYVPAFSGRYVRGVATIADTPILDAACTIFVEKRAS